MEKRAGTGGASAQHKTKGGRASAALPCPPMLQADEGGSGATQPSPAHVQASKGGARKPGAALALIMRGGDEKRRCQIVDAEIIAIESEFVIIPSFDFNALELDGYGYPIIPDYGPSKGLLYELRSSMRGSNFRSIQLTRDKDGSDFANAIAFQKAFTKHIIENLKVDPSLKLHSHTQELTQELATVQQMVEEL
ncbi:hypothetical protein L7F22_000191 [Adiantum nelumboides]|nr:hypothetical protein [Adiantum nelumboides]